MPTIRRSFIVAVAALVTGCHPATRSAPAQSSSLPTPTAAVPVHVESQGNAAQPATFSASEHNRRIYFVTAKSSVGDRLADGTFVVALSQPHVVFYDRAGKTLSGDSPKALIVERNKTITMSGGVTARTQDGAVLTCDMLTYDGRVDRIHGEGNVVLTSARGDRLTGDAIDGDIRLNHVTVNAK
jgi:lipopolysaccharide assembly outer membrane protein LptD (OstA)